MKKVIIAFDVDGTLITNTNPDNRIHGQPDNDDVPNVNIINLLMLLAHMKNTKIVVWSGGGAEYAATWGRRLGLDKYVWKYASKIGSREVFFPMTGPDIAIDDIQACELGLTNLIVREK